MIFICLCRGRLHFNITHHLNAFADNLKNQITHKNQDKTGWTSENIHVHDVHVAAKEPQLKPQKVICQVWWASPAQEGPLITKKWSRRQGKWRMVQWCWLGLHVFRILRLSSTPLSHIRRFPKTETESFDWIKNTCLIFGILQHPRKLPLLSEHFLYCRNSEETFSNCYVF